MRKRLVIGAAAALSLMLAGCQLPEEDALWEMVPFERVPAPVVIAAPSTVPTEAMPAFEIGQQIFAVYQHEGGTGIRMCFVVAVDGDTVAATTAVPGSGMDGDLLMFPVWDCYTESADAWTAAGMESLE